MTTLRSGARAAGADEATPAPDEQTAAIAQLAWTRDPEGVERLADEITRAGAQRWTGDARDALVEALVRCLTGDSIHQDADAEDAVCSALATMGVMTRSGNLVFELIADHALAPNDAIVVRRYRAWLPTRYTTRTNQTGS